MSVFMTILEWGSPITITPNHLISITSRFKQISIRITLIRPYIILSRLDKRHCAQESCINIIKVRFSTRASCDNTCTCCAKQVMKIKFSKQLWVTKSSCTSSSIKINQGLDGERSCIGHCITRCALVHLALIITSGERIASQNEQWQKHWESNLKCTWTLMAAIDVLSKRASISLTAYSFHKAFRCCPRETCLKQGEALNMHRSNLGCHKKYMAHHQQTKILRKKCLGVFDFYLTLGKITYATRNPVWM